MMLKDNLRPKGLISNMEFYFRLMNGKMKLIAFSRHFITAKRTMTIHQI